MNSSTETAFSVIIPAYNMQDQIGACLASVFRQTVQSFEILVIDDASTDDTRAVVGRFADPRLRLLSRSPGGPGPGPARNLGIREARHPWCAFLDADDEWDEHHLQAMVDAIAELPDDVGFLFSGFRVVEAGRPTVPDEFSRKHVGGGLTTFDFAAFVAAWIGNANAPNRTSATVIRRDVLERAGGFPETEKCRRGEDKDAWLRAAALTRMAYVPALTMSYLSVPRGDDAERSWFANEPCICDTVSSLLDRTELAAYRRLLQRLHNEEIFQYVWGAARVGAVNRAVFRGFYAAADPLKYVLVWLLWLSSRLGSRRVRQFRQQMRRRQARAGSEVSP